MSEKVIIRQKKNYETSIMALNPDELRSGIARLVHSIHELTPYGMVIAGLGTCTAFVVNTYAEHHNLDVNAVELKLEDRRTLKDDCVHCEEIDKYEDQIHMFVSYEGNLTSRGGISYSRFLCSVLFTRY